MRTPLFLVLRIPAALKRRTDDKFLLLKRKHVTLECFSLRGGSRRVRQIMRINSVKKDLKFIRDLFSLSLLRHTSVSTLVKAQRSTEIFYFLSPTLLINSRNVPPFFHADSPYKSKRYFPRDNSLRSPFPCRDAEI